MEKLYHLTAPDAGRRGERTTLDLAESRAEDILEDLSNYLSKEDEVHPHMTHANHYPARGAPPARLCHLVVHHRAGYAPWKLVLDRQCAIWAHEALSDVLSSQNERAQTKTVGRVTVNTTGFNQGPDGQQH